MYGASSKRTAACNNENTASRVNNNSGSADQALQMSEWGPSDFHRSALHLNVAISAKEAHDESHE